MFSYFFDRKLESQQYLGACARHGFSGAQRFTDRLTESPCERFRFFTEKLIINQIWTPARAAFFQERNASPIPSPNPLVSVFMFFKEKLIINPIWAPTRAAFFEERNVSPIPRPNPLVSVFMFFTEKLII